MSIFKNTPTNDNDGCAGIEILLAEYCADELDRAEVDLVEVHLEHCAQCRAELAREHYLRGTLADLPVVKCPDRVTESLLATIEDVDQVTGSPSTNPLSRSWTTYVGWAAAAAAAVLIITSPLGSDRPHPGPDKQLVQSQTVGQEQYSAAEIKAASQDLKLGLLLATKFIDQTERSTVKEIFGRQLPESLSRSFKTQLTHPEGEQG